MSRAGIVVVLVAVAILSTATTVQARNSATLAKLHRAHRVHHLRTELTSTGPAEPPLVKNATLEAAAAETPSTAAKQVIANTEKGESPSQAVEQVQTQIAAGKEAQGESPSQAAASAAQTVGAAAGNLPPAAANAATKAADTEEAQEQAGAVIAQVMGASVAPPIAAAAENAKESKELADELKKPPPLGDPEKDPMGKTENERENIINTEEATIVHKLDKLRKEALASKEAWIKEAAENKKKHKKAVKAHERGQWHDYHNAPVLGPVKSSSCTRGC